MEICKAPACKGFTYVGLLLAIVFFGLGSVRVARVLASSERELLFVRRQFSEAIGSYYASDLGVRRYPAKLKDLLAAPVCPLSTATCGEFMTTRSPAARQNGAW